MPIYYKKVSASESSHYLSSSEYQCNTLSTINDDSDWTDQGLELSSIELQTPLVGESEDACSSPIRIETKHGPILLTEQSEPSLPVNAPVLLTVHDLGLNAKSNFIQFFASSEMRLLLRGFRLLHLTLPGQQDCASRLPLKYRFPSIQSLSETIDFALTYFRIDSIVGFGQGLGANLLLRFALRCPNQVRGLLLIQGTAERASWSEWFYHKRNLRVLRDEQQASLAFSVQQYLIWSQFGRVEDSHTEQLINELRSRLRAFPPNSHNLAGLIESWMNRDALPLQRPSTPLQSKEPEKFLFKGEILLVTGMRSPHLESVEQLFAKLAPRNSSCIRFRDCANPIEEQPQKLAQAMALFLQGLGHSLHAFQRRVSLRAGLSMPSLNILASQN